MCCRKLQAFPSKSKSAAAAADEGAGGEAAGTQKTEPYWANISTPFAGGARGCGNWKPSVKWCGLVSEWDFFSRWKAGYSAWDVPEQPDTRLHRYIIDTDPASSEAVGNGAGSIGRASNWAEISGMLLSIPL